MSLLSFRTSPLAVVVLIVGGALSSATSRAADAKAEPTTAAVGSAKFTYVLVHGAWAGGWEHKKVDELLAADGHKVYRVTLTGQGERVHLASPDIDLNTHIADVVNLILWEQLTDVVLVGHSYGGMVITGVVDQIPDRFKHVIYLDAFLPEDGESLYSSMGMTGPPTPAVNGFVALGNVDRSDDPLPHVVPQSVKCFNLPIVLRHQDVAQKVPTTYILTVDEGKKPEEDAFFRFYERAKARKWHTEIMEGSHVVHITRPRALVDLLERAAAQ